MIHNKRGQTLILFVILIPIMLGLCALVIDTGLVIANKSHLKEVTKTVIKETIEEMNVDMIKTLLEKNDVDCQNLEVKIVDDRMYITNEIEIDTYLGQLLE
ncbi:MAG: hypothetical protein K2J20_02015 [Bacilli bacterium]|nr:hypothetical protein [Bacilli bacterium]